MEITDSVYRLDGRCALVVGAASGIGRAICIALSAAGADVACADIDEAGARTTFDCILERGNRAIAIEADATNFVEACAMVKTTVETFKRLDVLVYGAAVRDATVPILALDEDVWNRILSVNLTGSFLCTKAALPAMIESGGGSIILVASQMGRVGAPGRSPYCATKGALIQFVKVIAAEHAAQNIRANTLSPGAVATDRVAFRYGSTEIAKKELAPKYLLGRIGRPDEIGAAAVFLASPASSFMTGADLLVDGGYTAV